MEQLELPINIPTRNKERKGTKESLEIRVTRLEMEIALLKIQLEQSQCA